MRGLAAGSNDRGQYLRIFESGGGYPSGGSSVMIPCGPGNTCLQQFYAAVEKMAGQCGLLVSVLATRGGCSH